MFGDPVVGFTVAWSSKILPLGHAHSEIEPRPPDHPRCPNPASRRPARKSPQLRKCDGLFPGIESIIRRGAQLIQEPIREGLHAVTPYEPKMKKIMRMHSVTSTMENGFVYLPEKAHWLADYLHELTTFPKGKFDDQCDSTSQALIGLKQARALTILFGCINPYQRRSCQKYMVITWDPVHSVGTDQSLTKDPKYTALAAANAGIDQSGATE